MVQNDREKQSNWISTKDNAVISLNRSGIKNGLHKYLIPDEINWVSSYDQMMICEQDSETSASANARDNGHRYSLKIANEMLWRLMRNHREYWAKLTQPIDYN